LFDLWFATALHFSEQQVREKRMQQTQHAVGRKITYLLITAILLNTNSTDGLAKTNRCL